jgi:hypothetical protein
MVASGGKGELPMYANLDLEAMRKLDDSELDRVSGGGLDVDRTLAATAAAMFGCGAVGLGALALTALYLRNPNY